MALILKKLFKQYVHVIYDLQDPTFEDSPLCSVWTLLGFWGVYMYTVKKIGPELMKHRKPYNIRNLIIVYNILQILINVKICYESYKAIMMSPYLLCVEVPDKGLSNLIRKQFMILKMADCIETLFFVLRKSYRQISFLHVYHHCGMVLAGWISHKYNAGDAQFYVSCVNGFVHAVMFCYYLLTSIDPEWKKNITMKKTLTQIQLIQFLSFIGIFSATALIPGCKGLIPLLSYIFVIQNLFMFLLFSDFYIKAYLKPTQNVKAS